MPEIECPQCHGGGPSVVFVNRGDAGCAVESRFCSLCAGVGTVSEYTAGLYAAGRELTKLRVSRGVSLREAARMFGCSPSELSSIEHGRRPAHHDILADKLRALPEGGNGDD